MLAAMVWLHPPATEPRWQVDLTQAGSRFLSETEGCYAIIELEMLAVCWAIIKYHTF